MVNFISVNKMCNAVTDIPEIRIFVDKTNFIPCRADRIPVQVNCRNFIRVLQSLDTDGDLRIRDKYDRIRFSSAGGFVIAALLDQPFFGTLTDQIDHGRTAQMQQFT